MVALRSMALILLPVALTAAGCSGQREQTTPSTSTSPGVTALSAGPSTTAVDSLPPAGATWTIVEPYIAGPRTEGPCRIPYSAQVALVDPSVGTVLGLRDVPWFGRLVDWGDGFAVIYDGINQPDGVVALDNALRVSWQAELIGADLTKSDEERLVDRAMLLWGREMG